MAIPAFLNSSWSFKKLEGVIDVQTVINEIADQLLNCNTPAWTDQGGGLYKSPVDAAGRFFDLLFTRINAQKIEMRVRDGAGVGVAWRRMINLPSTNFWTVRIYTGQNHFMADLDAKVGCQYLLAGILDPAPMALAAHTHYCFGNGSYTNTDSTTGASFSYSTMIDDVTPGIVQRVSAHGYRYGNKYIYKTLGGKLVHYPYEMWARPTGNANFKYAGRAYQMLTGDAVQISPGAEVSVAIESGVAAKFTMVGGMPTNYNRGLMVRSG